MDRRTGHDLANIARLYDYARRLAADPRITDVHSLVDLDPADQPGAVPPALREPGRAPRPLRPRALAPTTKGDLTAFTLYHAFGPNRDEAKALVQDLRDPTGPLAPPVGMQVLGVSGARPTSSDVGGAHRAPTSRGLGLFIVADDLPRPVRAPRSVVLPAKAIVMNTLSILAAFGALVWVFQDGNLSLLARLPAARVRGDDLPVILCVLFGLSMDYEVFLLTPHEGGLRPDRRQPRGGGPGLDRSGRIVVGASIVVAWWPGCSPTPTSSSSRRWGWASRWRWRSTATIVRALLVPATMRLLGKWNWWLPARLGQVLRDRLPATDSELEERYR